MTAAVWLVLSGLMYALQLQTGSFPRPLTAREALNALCAELGAEPIQCIGRRFVMYRPSKENPRIVLE